MNKNKKSKVLLIGWDAADWKVIDPLIQQGKMPALKGLIERGVYGKIQTLDPPLSPMLWTSIASGFRADRHGIGGFVEPNPDGTGLRPVTSTSRKVKAIWNILHHKGLKSNVVSWWPSNPAEPINGVMVSNHYQVASKPIDEEWEMPKGTVHPKSLSDELKQWRVHPNEITLSMTLPFIPNLESDMELRNAKRTSGVVKVIANAASVHAVSTNLMRTTDWDFMAVYHDAIDHFSHLAMRFHPPRRPEINEKEFEDYKNVVESGYRFHDMMLERTLELIDEDTTVLLVSDHGFHSDHQRPKYIPKEPSGPAVEHSPYGIFVMSGPGIKNGGQRVSGASILDITPTLLAHMDFEVGQDMEGKVLHGVFDHPKEVKMIPSWEEVNGDFGMHDPDMMEDPWQAMEALQQLVDLGYIDEIGDDKLLAVEKAKRENQYYVARNLINAKKWHQALEILERIYAESKITRYGQRLAFVYLSTNKLIKCQELIDELRRLEKEISLENKKEALKSNPNDPFGNSDYEEPMYLDFVEGLLHLKINRPGKALPILEKVQKKNPNNLQVALNIGKIFNQRKNFKASEKQFITALAIDNRNAQAHHGLGVSFLRRKMYAEAIEEFFAATEENFFIPNVHYHLGEAFYKTGYYTEAEQAFSVAVSLSPGMAKAHKWLVDLYRTKLNQPEKSLKHESFLDENIKGELCIVSGVQGSGNEAFLKTLEAQDFEVVINLNAKSSELRYLTDESKKLKVNQEWLSHQKGKLLFIAPQYLSQLPPNYNYKFIYLQRTLADIVDAKIANSGKSNIKKVLPLKKMNKTQEEISKIEIWMESQPLLNITVIDHDEFVNDTQIIIDQLKTFLD
jgi:predicted AlkP superfamily phosphohydrolase/phosphomutase/tetratricopeptide (TPR) repeat protein